MGIPFPLAFELIVEYGSVVSSFMRLLSKPIDKPSNDSRNDLTVEFS
jgi:hypothetical protein